MKFKPKVYAELCDHSYNPDTPPPEGWKIILNSKVRLIDPSRDQACFQHLTSMIPSEKNYYEQYQHGYQGTAYLHRASGNVVVVHVGTNFNTKDWIPNLGSDLTLAPKGIPTAHEEAKIFCKKVDQEIQELKRIHLNISLIPEHTGHSLGGAHAQWIAVENPTINAITFEAPGIRETLALEKQALDYPNVTNYVLKQNFINNTNTRIGKGFRLHMSIEDKIKLHGDYIKIKKSHSIKTCVNAFNQNGDPSRKPIRIRTEIEKIQHEVKYSGSTITPELISQLQKQYSYGIPLTIKTFTQQELDENTFKTTNRYSYRFRYIEEKPKPFNSSALLLSKDSVLTTPSTINSSFQKLDILAYQPESALSQYNDFTEISFISPRKTDNEINLKSILVPMPINYSLELFKSTIILPEQSNLNISHESKQSLNSKPSLSNTTLKVYLFDITRRGLAFSPSISLLIPFELSTPTLVTLGLAGLAISVSAFGVKSLVDYIQWKKMTKQEKLDYKFQNAVTEMQRCIQERSALDLKNIVNFGSPWNDLREYWVNKLKNIISQQPPDPFKQAKLFALDHRNYDALQEWSNNNYEKTVNSFSNFVNTKINSIESALTQSNATLANSILLEIEHWLPNHEVTQLLNIRSTGLTNPKTGLDKLKEFKRLHGSAQQKNVIAEIKFELLWKQALKSPSQICIQTLRTFALKAFQTNQLSEAREKLLGTFLYDFKKQSALSNNQQIASSYDRLSKLDTFIFSTEDTRNHIAAHYNAGVEASQSCASGPSLEHFKKAYQLSNQLEHPTDSDLILKSLAGINSQNNQYYSESTLALKTIHEKNLKQYQLDPATNLEEIPKSKIENIHSTAIILSEISDQQQDYTASIQYKQQALLVKPADIETRISLAKTHCYHGDTPKALNELKRAQETLNANHPQSENVNQFISNIEEYEFNRLVSDGADIVTHLALFASTLSTTFDSNICYIPKEYCRNFRMTYDVIGADLINYWKWTQKNKLYKELDGPQLDGYWETNLKNPSYVARKALILSKIAIQTHLINAESGYGKTFSDTVEVADDIRFSWDTFYDGLGSDCFLLLANYLESHINSLKKNKLLVYESKALHLFIDISKVVGILPILTKIVKVISPSTYAKILSIGKSVLTAVGSGMAGLSSLGIAGQALVFGVGFGALCVAGYGLYKLYKAVDQHLEQKLLSDKLHNASIYAMQWSALKNQVIDYENSGQKENVRLSKIEADNAFKKSLEHYQEVLKMIPSDTKEHKEVWEEKTRLELMHQFENNEFDKILKTCNAILEEKNNENIQIMRAQAYIAIGKPWLAENDYLFLGDTNITAQIQLSYLSEQYGDLYNAALYTARAISLLQTELSNLRDEIKKINNGTYHLGGAADSAYELIKNNPKAASLLTLDNKFKKHTELDIKQQSLQSSEKELSEQKEHQNTISRSVQDTKYQLAGNIAATVMTSFIQSIADIIFQWQKITYNNPYNFPIFTIIPLPNTSSKKPIVTSTNLERLSRSLSNRPQQQKLYNNLIKSSRTIIPTHSYRENIFSNLSKNIQTQKLHTNLAFFSKVNPLNKQSNTMYIFQRK